MNIFSIREFEPEPIAKVVDLMEKKPLADIRVVGVGTAGVNVIAYMVQSDLTGVKFIAINTDKQHLDALKGAETLQIGSNRTGGRGSGGDTLIGEQAANEDREKIAKSIAGADLVFLTTGLGGGTGTGALPIIAKIAREQGALTVAVVTLPFAIEGDERMGIAEEGIKKLQEIVDTHIVIPNENLYKLIDNKTSIRQTFKYANDILCQGVRSISDLVTKVGFINLDFADVEAVIKGQGVAHLGIGVGRGDSRADNAAKDAIDNTLLDNLSIEGASRLLVNIAGPEEFPMAEVHEILNIVRTKVGSSAKLKFGITFDSELGEDVKVTVIATGFQSAAAAAGQEDNSRKKTKEADNFIDFKRFEEMRGGLRDKRPLHDHYYGITKPREFHENLEVPTALRKHNLDQNDGSGEKSAAGGKDA